MIASEGRALRVPGFEEAALWRSGHAEMWAGRNPRTAAEVEERWTTNWKRSRRETVTAALAGVPRDASVLEVGCGTGAQLDMLRALGFTRLAGVDVGAAVLSSAWFTAVQADGCWLPFRDGAFDLVFTVGTLMHIPPGYRRLCAVRELARVSRRWLWVTEYQSREPRVHRFAAGILPALWTENWLAVFRALLPDWESGAPRTLARLNTETTLAEYMLRRPHG